MFELPGVGRVEPPAIFLTHPTECQILYWGVSTYSIRTNYIAVWKDSDNPEKLNPRAIFPQFKPWFYKTAFLSVQRWRRRWEWDHMMSHCWLVSHWDCDVERSGALNRRSRGTKTTTHCSQIIVSGSRQTGATTQRNNHVRTKQMMMMMMIFTSNEK